MNIDKLKRDLFVGGMLYTVLALAGLIAMAVVFAVLCNKYIGNLPSEALPVVLIYIGLICGKGDGFSKLIKVKNLGIQRILCYLPIFQSLAIYLVIKRIPVSLPTDEDSSLTARRKNIQRLLSGHNLLTPVCLLFYVSVIAIVVPNVTVQAVLDILIPVFAVLYILIETWYTNIIFRVFYRSEIVNWLNYITPCHYIFCIYLAKKIERLVLHKK